MESLESGESQMSSRPMRGTDSETRRGRNMSEQGDEIGVELRLTGKQRRYLRGLAHKLAPVVMVGHAGVSAEVVRAVDEALTTHELIKVRLLRPPDKHAMAEELARRCSAVLCGLIGHMVILYRPHPENPRIRV